MLTSQMETEAKAKAALEMPVSLKTTNATAALIAGSSRLIIGIVVVIKNIMLWITQLKK